MLNSVKSIVSYLIWSILNLAHFVYTPNQRLVTVDWNRNWYKSMLYMYIFNVDMCERFLRIYAKINKCTG